MPSTPVTVEYQIRNTGFAIARERHVVRGGRWARRQLPILFALIRHPALGWGLFDTGCAPRLVEATERWPYCLYRWIVPIVAPAKDAAHAHLGRLGIDAADVAWIVISHFHADHVAGLHDFAHARFYTTAEAFDAARSLRGFRALRRAVLPQLLPADFVNRATLLREPAGPIVPPFGRVHDIFADGSILLVPLPGHAPGQVGALLRSTRGYTMLAADACWLSRSYRENLAPHWITRPLHADAAAGRMTIARLHAFAAAHEEIEIIPTHCPEAYQRVVTP